MHASAPSHELRTHLLQLANAGWTGCLHLQHAALWLVGGRVVLVDGALPPVDVIRDAALPVGVDLDDLDWNARNGGTPLLDAVIEHAPAAETVVARLLHEHNLNGIFELLATGERSPEAEEGVRHHVGDRFAQPMLDLIDEADRRIELWRAIADHIPTTTVMFRMSKELPGGAETRVEPTEWRYLALLDGSRTVSDIIDETAESPFRVCSTLYRMVLQEWIEPVPA